MSAKGESILNVVK